MPDVDVDFDDRRRGEVIRYVTEKYGDDRVAQIVTYGTIKAKQALKDSARVLGMPFSVGDKLTKAMPPAIMGKDISLSRHGHADGRSATRRPPTSAPSSPRTPRRRRSSRPRAGIENLKRQWGVHAAGVIMSAEPLIDVLPIMKREDDGAIITQFDQPPLEDLGLLKMDFLGLRNLTVIQDALNAIELNTGNPLEIEELDLDADEPTYELLSRGDTLGVFQLDGGPMRALLRQMKPTNFEDISALIALYRPGPDGHELAHQLRAAQERAAVDRRDPSGAGRAAAGDARSDLRRHRVPGAGDGGRAEGGRILARSGRHPAQGDGQEEEVGARQAVRRLRGRHARQRVQQAGCPSALGHPDALRRLRLQQGAQRRLRRAQLLDRLPQGEPSRPSTWRPC